MSQTFTIAEVLVEAAKMLRKSGVPDARLDAGVLLAHVLDRDRTFVITNAEKELEAGDVDRYRTFIERRAEGVPIQYLTGHQEFYKLDFIVTPDVLIPRPDTELLVEIALDLLDVEDESQKICDVGTGSGCITVSLLYERPHATGLGLDVSSKALVVARRNAERHGVGRRLRLLESDCFSALDASRETFTLIAANPPYVPEATYESLQREVRDHEPRIALTPGADGLSIVRRLLDDAPPFLCSGGHLLLEIGFDQNASVRALVDNSVWDLLDIQKDIQGIPRTVVLRKK